MAETRTKKLLRGGRTAGRITSGASGKRPGRPAGTRPGQAAGKQADPSTGKHTDDTAVFDARLVALGEEIRTLREGDGADSVTKRVKIGKRLALAHRLLAHGHWGAFLTKQARVPRQTAKRLMDLATWAQQNAHTLERVEHLGPTKVYSLMAAPPEALKRLLARKQHQVPGTRQRKILTHLSPKELRKVLQSLADGEPTQEAVERVEAQEMLKELGRDASGVVSWTNKLVKMTEQLDPKDIEKVAKVRKQLFRSLKKLDKAFGDEG